MKVWRWSFFKKCWKFDADFKNAIKIWENVFGFEENCVGTCCANFSLLITRVDVIARQPVESLS